MAKQPHEFSNDECTICHIVPDSRSPLKQKGKQKSSSVTDMCLTCHTALFEEGYMHPVDIKPKKVRIPLDFPLSQDGALTCNTCHDPHADYETPFGEPSSFLRRIETGKAFCDACHINSLATATGHQSLFNVAHYDSKPLDPDSEVQIDALSKECISCHDGIFASSVPINIKAANWQHSNEYLKFDKGFKHPIGMHYEKVRLQNTKNRLRPIAEVDRRLHFFDGGIMGCGTCHDPFSSEKYKLVITVNGEKLCLSCHNF
nr:hypothetical protein [Desulfobulbaceae bacterium]